MADGVDTGAEAAGGFLRWRRHHALPPGTGCYNCGTVLRGPWCYVCGQLGEDFHRSAHHLIFEALESFFHADGRVWRTLPGLLFKPGHLTRSYLDGKRAPQVPPMRLFLIVLLIVFVAGDIVMARQNPALLHLDPGEKAETVLSSINVHVYPAWDADLTAWLKTHLGRAIAHPEALLAAMGDWAHRFAFMTLPISALMLSAIFLFRRGVVLFDHLIFSMHSLSFLGLIVASMMLLSTAGAEWTGWLLLLPPVHLFFHMRGTYATGVVSTLVRMALLFTASSVAFALMMAGLVLVGLAVLRE
jgi:hypothetical protein